MVTMGVFDDNGVKWFPPQPNIELEAFWLQEITRAEEESLENWMIPEEPQFMKNKVDWKKEGF